MGTAARTLLVFAEVNWRCFVRGATGTGLTTHYVYGVRVCVPVVSGRYSVRQRDRFLFCRKVTARC